MIPRKISSWKVVFQHNGCKSFNTCIAVKYSQCLRSLYFGVWCPVHFGTSIQIQLSHPINDHIRPESEKTLAMPPPSALSFTVTANVRLSDTSPTQDGCLSCPLCCQHSRSNWVWEDEHVSKTAARASRGFHDPCPETIITFYMFLWGLNPPPLPIRPHVSNRRERWEPKMELLA